MSCIDQYLLAVAQRKAIDKNKGVNYAIVAQLEQDDVPRLIEIVRVQARALCQIIDAIDTPTADHEEMGQLAAQAHIKAEEIADAGSKACWGEWKGGNGGHTPPT